MEICGGAPFYVTLFTPYAEIALDVTSIKLLPLEPDYIVWFFNPISARNLEGAFNDLLLL